MQNNITPELFEDSIIEDLYFKGSDELLLGYIPSVFISASLPLRAVRGNSFKRKYNNIELCLNGSNGLPYGKYGRILLSVLTTHAVLEKNTNGSLVIVFESRKALLDELKLPLSRQNDIFNQLERFTSCTFSYKGVVETKFPKKIFKDGELKYLGGTNSRKIIDIGSILFLQRFTRDISISPDGNKKDIGIRIELSEGFVKLAKQHAVPIDYNVYKNIEAPLGKDLYAWFVYRNNSIKENEEIFISRSSLIKQFMPFEKNMDKQERSHFQHIIKTIKTVKANYYKNLNVTIRSDGSGILLKKSIPEVECNDKRYIPVIDSVSTVWFF